MSLRSIVSVAILWLCAIAAPAQADIFNFGRYSLTAGEEPGEYAFTASLPQIVATDAAPTWPEGCRETARDRQTGAGRAQLSYEIRCDRPFAADAAIETPWAVDGGAFLSAMGERTVEAGDAGARLPVGQAEAVERSFRAVAVDYGWQGILHILGGWDHLAFVLCLCLLARGRELLALVTTFTLGHSVSLALAFFDVVRVAVPPVEAVIALSIAFMAREALIANRAGGGDAAPARTVADRRRYAVIVTVFGLLHGLGFATALGELGVAHRERVEGLVFFNVGVELGQLMFVVAVTAAMAAARAAGRAERVRATALHAAGALGCFWMVERVTDFGLLHA